MPSVRKLAAGYYAAPGMDLVDLFIGAEGTLGVDRHHARRGPGAGMVRRSLPGRDERQRARSPTTSVAPPIAADAGAHRRRRDRVRRRTLARPPA
jgi:hypothetical protein